MKILRNRWFVVAIASGFFGILALVGLLSTRQQAPRRVRRAHLKKPPKEYAYLAKRIDFPRRDHLLSPKEAEEDLDQLEWLIENQYSYRDLKGVDYRACLDSIRAGLGTGIAREDLGYQLTKFMALFGDGHSRVASRSVKVRSLCSEFSPFLAGESNGRIVAFRADRSDFLDPEFPFLLRMDGLPVKLWIEAAEQWVGRASPQFVRQRAIRYLQYVELLRKELGLDRSTELEVELESCDAESTKQHTVSLVDEPAIHVFWPRSKTKISKVEDVRVETNVLPGNIGYLRFVLMREEPEFLADLVGTMHQLADTDGLIIDLRGNGGGSRAPLRTLFPFFMEDNDPPWIVNVAAYRLGMESRRKAFEARYLYPGSSGHWSDAEREAINIFAETFQPEWPLPNGEFSEWHYFVISPCRDQNYYFYDKPVVILQDSLNFSATDIFLGAFKGWKNVTLMGLPSGGGSGCRVKHRLRNSRITVSLSSMASFRPDGQLYDGKGIQPDILVNPEPTYFIGKTDATLEAAIQKLSKKSN